MTEKKFTHRIDWVCHGWIYKAVQKPETDEMEMKIRKLDHNTGFARFKDASG